jgi:Ser/Thr protein kinase RdoA (MazF antagonist)
VIQQDSVRIDATPLMPAGPGDRPLDLREADLRDGRFAGADLRDADLQHATLAKADLNGADLRGARLTQADLALAHLQGADLRNADLGGADLAGADLRGARLEGADLTGADLQWARIDGALGLPAGLLLLRRADGRVRGEATRPDGEEPALGLRAFQRGRAAHAAGRLGLAERHYATALGWVPDSDAVHYALAAVALERGDLTQAERSLRDTVALDPDADRARLDLALLSLARDEPAEATTWLSPMAERIAWIPEVLQAMARGDPAQARHLLEAEAPDSPMRRWVQRPPRVPTLRATVPDLLGDPVRREAEHLDLLEVLRERERPAWVWHSVIARALRIGAMDLAQRAEQRLSREAPEHRLWSLQLKHLDVTAEAMHSLVRTRARNLGEVQSLAWVAIGVHGPTARLECEGGVVFAKRYVGSTRPLRSVLFTHRVCRTAAERGLQVPVAMIDSEGADVLSFGEDLLALYPDLQAQSIADIDVDIATAAKVGAHLAQVHLLLADLATGPGRPRGGVRVGTRILRHPAPGQAWQVVLGQDSQCAALVARNPLTSRLQSLLDATARRLRGVLADCPPGLVHGDFGPGNVLERADGQYAVVDWDLCDVDLPVWDLARATDLLAARWPQEPTLPVEVRGDVLRAMVRGYHEVRPLSRAERAALPVLIAASRVDLDASVLPIGASLEPDLAPAVLERMFLRLSRAAAGAPELADRTEAALEP